MKWKETAEKGERKNKIKYEIQRINQQNDEN